MSLQFSRLIWMAKFYENSALKAILFKDMNEIVSMFCTFSICWERFFADGHKNLLTDCGFNENQCSEIHTLGYK